MYVLGNSKLGLKGRQDIAGGEAPCKDNKKIQAPKGRQDALSFPRYRLGMCLYQKLLLHFVFVIKTMVDCRKEMRLSQVVRPFLSPLRGLLCYCIYQGLHPWLYTFSPSGLL